MTPDRLPNGRDRRRDSALRDAIALAVLTALLPSCARDAVPRPRLPQVEQATEAMHGGGERYRDHHTCAQSSKSAHDLVQCMETAHWQFVAHGVLYPEPECWEAREHGELERLIPQCFIRAADHP